MSAKPKHIDFLLKSAANKLSFKSYIIFEQINFILNLSFLSFLKRFLKIRVGLGGFRSVFRFLNGSLMKFSQIF